MGDKPRNFPKLRWQGEVKQLRLKSPTSIPRRNKSIVKESASIAAGSQGAVGPQQSVTEAPAPVRPAPKSAEAQGYLQSAADKAANVVGYLVDGVFGHWTNGSQD